MHLMALIVAISSCFHVGQAHVQKLCPPASSLDKLKFCRQLALLVCTTLALCVWGGRVTVCVFQELLGPVHTPPHVCFISLLPMQAPIAAAELAKI